MFVRGLAKGVEKAVPLMSWGSPSEDKKARVKGVETQLKQNDYSWLGFGFACVERSINLIAASPVGPSPA